MSLHKDIKKGLDGLSETICKHLEDTAESLRRFVEKDYITDEDREMIERWEKKHRPTEKSASRREEMDTIEMRFTRDELPEENRAIVMFTRIMPLGRDMEMRGFYNGGAFLTEFGEEIKTEVHGWYYLDSVSTEEQ